MVVAGVAVYDVEILYLVEVVLGGIGGVDAAHARVESAAQYGGQSGLLETLLIGPLPAVLEVSLVFRLIVGCVQIVAAACQAGLHDSEVLIGQGQVHHQFGLVVVEERFELLHVVGVNLCGLDIHVVAFGMDGFYDLVAFLLAA